MSAFEELASIFAVGYLRLQAIMREEDKPHDDWPIISGPAAPNSLDTPLPQSDEWCAANAASHLKERG